VILFNLCGHGHFDLRATSATSAAARGLRVSARESRSRARVTAGRLSDRLTGGFGRCVRKT
jgi:hypothetical protein